MARAAAAVLLVFAAGCAGQPASGTGPEAGESTGPEAGEGRGPEAAQGWGPWAARPVEGEQTYGCGVTEELLLCPTSAGGLVARSAGTGKVSWRVEAGEEGGETQSFAKLVVADGLAFVAGGRTVRAVDLRSRGIAWTQQLPEGRQFGSGLDAAHGIVYASTDNTSGPGLVAAYRAASGTALWQRELEGAELVAIGTRLYTAGSRAVARDGETGDTVATSPHDCQALITGGSHLICNGAFSASDHFPPVTLTDPETLEAVRTLWEPGSEPTYGGGTVSGAGVLVLRQCYWEGDCAHWNGIDVRTGDHLWSTADSPWQSGDHAVIVEDRVVFPVSGRRIASVDLRQGPKATGAAGPRYSPKFSEAKGDVTLLAYGNHIVLLSGTEPVGIRSIPVP